MRGILINHVILIFNRYCNNGTEFKKEVLAPTKSLSIRVVNGHSYHPQTQGSIEKSNGTFKDHLHAIQVQNGRLDND